MQQKIGVIIDWARCKRGNYWPDLFEALDPAPEQAPDDAERRHGGNQPAYGKRWSVTYFPMADLLLQTPTDEITKQLAASDPTFAHAKDLGTEKQTYRVAESLNDLNDQDVIIFNWDVLNGDPDFGAHLVQMWVRHHRPELITWVGKGGGARRGGTDPLRDAVAEGL